MGKIQGKTGQEKSGKKGLSKEGISGILIERQKEAAPKKTSGIKRIKKLKKTVDSQG